MHNKKLIKVIYNHILLFVLFIVYYFLNKYLDVKILCPFHYITGYLCPGCGITRCLFSILEGNFLKAYYYNRFVFLLLPFFIIFYVYSLYLEIYNPKKKLNIPNYVYTILFIIMIIFGIVRNIL